MKSKRIRRMVGWRRGSVAVIRVEYEDGVVESCILKGGRPYENGMEPMALDYRLGMGLDRRKSVLDLGGDGARGVSADDETRLCTRVSARDVPVAQGTSHLREVR